MTLEQQYKASMEALGIYNPAFDSEIHLLAILEREHSRTMKAWKATAASKDAPPSPTDPLYAVIQVQRRDILAHKDALGLTPKALKRLQRVQAAESAAPEQSSPGLSSALAQLKSLAAAGVSGSDTGSL